MNLKLRQSLIVLVLSANALTSCKTEAPVIDQSELRNEIEQSDTRGGIIGELGLFEIPTIEYSEVNIIQVLNRKKGEDGEVEAQGSSTRLRDYQNKRDYVLTVAHLFDYDRAGYKASDFILYVAKNGSFDEGDWFFISPKLYANINPRNNDIIFIPVEYDEHAAAYDLAEYLPKSEPSLPSPTTIVSVLNLKHTKKIRKVRQTANLLEETNQSAPGWKTDADLFKGMSGSPAFDDDQKIIGIVSRVTKVDNCKKFNSLFCHNIIVSLNKQSVAQQHGIIFADNMFRHIEK